jgi:hypothetical protein
MPTKKLAHLIGGTLFAPALFLKELCYNKHLGEKTIQPEQENIRSLQDATAPRRSTNSSDKRTFPVHCLTPLHQDASDTPIFSPVRAALEKLLPLEFTPKH